MISFIINLFPFPFHWLFSFKFIHLCGYPLWHMSKTVLLTNWCRKSIFWPLLSYWPSFLNFNTGKYGIWCDKCWDDTTKHDIGKQKPFRLRTQLFLLKQQKYVIFETVCFNTYLGTQKYIINNKMKKKSGYWEKITTFSSWNNHQTKNYWNIMWLCFGDWCLHTSGCDIVKCYFIVSMHFWLFLANVKTRISVLSLHEFHVKPAIRAPIIAQPQYEKLLLLLLFLSKTS